MHTPLPFHITISGSNIQSFLLAYQISKLDINNLNVTLLGKFDQEFMKIAEAGLNHQLPNANSLNLHYIDRKIIEFCGNEPELKQLIKDTHLEFKIKRSEILFNKGTYEQGTDNSFMEEIYKIDQERDTINSIVKYGLSHLTAMSLFSNLQKHLQRGNFETLSEFSMDGILRKILPPPQKPSSNGLEHLSQVIGLDQKYIRDYVNPLISSSYLHNVNSVATVFKLLPLYCQNHRNNGRTKNLVLHLNERMIAAKILFKLKDYKNIQIKNMKMLDFEYGKNKVSINYGSNERNSKNLQTDLLIVLEDFQEDNQKQISYYRTIIDGTIHQDDKFQEFYTIHFQNNPVLSVTRLCANECKNFTNSAYLVISRTKLQKKNLVMFVHYQILNHSKFWGARSQQTFSSLIKIKFNQNQRIYRISDTELITDNYQVKLLVFKNLANLIMKRVGEYRPGQDDEGEGERERGSEGEETDKDGEGEQN